MTSHSWRRRSGVVFGADGTIDRARDLLAATAVVAVLESDPEAPDAITVTVAVDDEGRVARIDPDRTGLAPGSALTDLVADLAEACEGGATFDDVSADARPAPQEGPVESQEERDNDPFDPVIDPTSIYVPDRGVVLTAAGAESLAELATALDVPVVAAPHGDGHVILVSEGPALTTVAWPEALKPAVVIEQGAAFGSVAVIEGEFSHLYTWDTATEVVPADADVSALVSGLVDDLLGPGALAASIATLADADVTAVRTAIGGRAGGPAVLIRALGLPESLVSFLRHATDVPALADAQVYTPEGPGHAWARAVSDRVTDAQAQMTSSMRERSEQMRDRAEQMRIRAEAARVRAESAFDAAETFTEEVVLPIRHSWWTPAAAAIEVVLGAAALHRAGRTARAGGKTTLGERAIGVGGVFLLIDASVNTTLFLASRIKRDL